MKPSLFETMYREHYQSLPKGLYVLPIVFMLLFAASLAGLALVRTDKIIEVDALILPRQVANSVLKQRGFILEQNVTPGLRVKRGQLLASVQLEDGSISRYLAQQDGVIVDSAIKPMHDGPYPEASLIASIIDPQALRLQLELPARWRGSVKPGSLARYRFDTLTQSQTSHVIEQEVRLLPDGSVHYLQFAELLASHQSMLNLGRKVPVKLLIERISLLDYFFNT